jgi:hypothetical protein
MTEGMTTRDIVQKLWNLCNILRDDGIIFCVTTELRIRIT